MDSAGDGAGAIAEMPGVHSSVYCAWNRRGTFSLNRVPSENAARDPVRGVALVPCGRTWTPIGHRDIGKDASSRKAA